MKGVYLGACRAYHPTRDLDYNDIVSGYHINLVCDMLDVDLASYDFILASPPCNYYSRCNYRRDVSFYALSTKHLLPKCIENCILSGKPFIVENVRNWSLFVKVGIVDLCNKNGVFIYEYGRHTYFTNIMFEFFGISQRQDFKNGGYRIKYGDDMSKYNQGGYNVHNVFERFMDVISDD